MEMEIYKAKNGKVSVDVTLDKDTVWLSLNQLTSLFERDKSTVSRHIKNILETKELLESSVVAKFATTATDGKIYAVDYYNLDMIISLGYRINSERGIEFRRWATETLKEHLVQGYTINQKRLAITGINEIEQSVKLLSRTLLKSADANDIGVAAISIITDYATTWRLLLQYDEDALPLPGKKKETKKVLDIIEAQNALQDFKKKLMAVGEATDLFGFDRADALQSILKNLEQTFGGAELYPNAETKAAHLLYFIIKDHPFADGNKRIGCLLFVLYLTLNAVAINKINDVALTALALLVAESAPAEKELIIKLIVNLLM